MAKEKKSSDIVFGIQLLIALANLAVFGVLFLAMGYFELIGADPAYFDEGTISNLNLINTVTKNFGITIDPSKPHRISTLMWAAALGFALISSAVSIMISNRRSAEAYEVT